MAELGDDAGQARVRLVQLEAGPPAIEVGGEIDVANSHLLKAALEDALAAQPTLITFDLTQLSYMDSSGLAVLLEAAARADTVIVRNPSPLIRRLLAATGVSGLFRMEP